MVKLLKSLPVLLLCHTATASYQNISKRFSRHNVFHKRAYSVPGLQEVATGDKGDFGPWPILESGTPHEKQAVRYCYADKRSADNLREIVKEAIDRWAPGLHPHTGLTIELDNPDSEVCDRTKTRDDALVIEDKTRDVTDPEDEDFNAGCVTISETTGYSHDKTDTKRGRHGITFCHLEPDRKDDKETRARAVRAMMHELGHAIGLTHEQQRPDFDKFITFRCSRLHGYDKEKLTKLVTEDFDGVMEHVPEIELRLELLCTHESGAKAYFPAALPYIKGDDLSDNRWEGFTTSSKFDFDSIMIYDSNSGAADPTQGKGWVIWRKKEYATAAWGRSIWQGGDQDPAKAKISSGDVERVGLLYPKRETS